ncbi:MAG: hypothetical protein WA101_00635 [Minisyncoccia bacterium]
MVKITCTTEEYNKFIGPRIRNVIQVMTKKRKKELDHKCQKCGNKRELEAAHIIGSERKTIIEKVLKKYRNNPKNELVINNLKKVEEEIILKHKPIDKYFKFLCSSCHKKYDKK